MSSEHITLDRGLLYTARSGTEPLSAAENILLPLLAPRGYLQSRAKRAQSSAISRGLHRSAGSSHVLIEPVTVQVLLREERKKEREERRAVGVGGVGSWREGRVVGVSDFGELHAAEVNL